MNERIGDAFLEGTKYRNLGPSDQQQGVAHPTLYSVLCDGRRITLPSPQALDLGSMGLREAIETRRSFRNYAEEPLALEELSFLLWCSQGVKPESTDKNTIRTVPSAGARHAFETLLLINRVDGLEPGLHQYDAAAHGLIQRESPVDIAEQLTAACLNQPIVRNSAATFIWVAERYRMAWRYGERGIRYLFLDAGHVCQNLYLAAESIAAGACAIGAFTDDEVNQLLGLDGIDRFVVYMAGVGKRES
ncbi:SagB/ThcOx family dehydrogenase [Candidatus Bipolaricaulota bacterium]